MKGFLVLYIDIGSANCLKFYKKKLYVFFCFFFFFLGGGGGGGWGVLTIKEYFWGMNILLIL